MNHTPFIIASYMAFTLFLLLDALLPLLHKRQVLRTLANRARREEKRKIL